MCWSIVVLRKFVIFGITELDKNEQALAFMKLVFERLEQFLNASMIYRNMLCCKLNIAFLIFSSFTDVRVFQPVDRIVTNFVERLKNALCFGWTSWLSTSLSTAATFSSVCACFGLPLPCLQLVLPVSRIFFGKLKFPLFQFFSKNSVSHRLRGSGSTVVTMTSKVNGKMEISTPCRSETR